MAQRVRSPQERRDAAATRRARRAEIDDPEVVMEAAASFLSVRSRSVEETRRRLRQHGYRADLCDRVIDRLVELGYLDDLAFATSWVESRDRAHPRGETALRRELQLKGIAAETIAEVLAHRRTVRPASTGAAPGHEDPDETERDAARRLLERRGASLRREKDPRRRREKAYSLLARNGFGPDVCSEVAPSIVHETLEDDVSV